MDQLSVDQLFRIAQEITELRLKGDSSANAAVVSLSKQLRFPVAADWLLFEERIFADQSDLFKKARVAGIWEDLPATVSGLVQHCLAGVVCPKRLQFIFFDMLGSQFMILSGEIDWTLDNILKHLPFPADYPLKDVVHDSLFLRSANKKLFQQ